MIYLDYNSTTPIDVRVLDAMNDVYGEHFGNPSSTHATGSHARGLVDESRAGVASLVNADARDVVFTSGATEANNMVVSWLAPDAKGRRILYGATEHKSIIRPCLYMAEKFGLSAEPIPVTGDGAADIQKYAALLAESHVDIVSVAAANGETGVINPVRDMARMAREHGAVFHCDAVQAAGKIPFDMDDLGVDIATLSGHKIYGPKGVGALVASRDVRKRLNPMIHGGGQEYNLRSGTENVPGIVGFAEACRIAQAEGLADSARQAGLRNSLEERLASSLEGVSANGSNSRRLPNTASIRIKGALADAIVVNLKKIEISTGSACSSSTMEPSHVLVAMGLSREEADESIRVSLGRPTAQHDIGAAIPDIMQAANYVRGKEAEMAGQTERC